MKNKLKIDDLRVKSFITEVSNDEKAPVLKGGSDSNNRSCAISVVYCYSENYCPTAAGPCLTRFC